jgi:MFS family permease
MHSSLDQFFPHWRLRNIALFYILSAIYNVWFVAGVWVFIWGRFMTNTQIGISDFITFSVGFLVEIPSGVMADMIGRKKAVLAGNILMTAGNFLIAISSSFLSITVWYLVWTVGYAFQSGATEALAYDTLRHQGLEDDWERVIATSTVISKAATLIAAALGGFLFTVWFRLPYFTLASFGIIGVIAAVLLQEIHVRRPDSTQTFSLYFQQIKDGVQTLGRRAVFPIALMSLTVAGVSYMYNWGLLRPLTGERFGYTPDTYAYLLSVISLAGILALGFLPKLRKLFSVEKLLFLLGGVYAVVFFAMGFSHLWLIGGILMILQSILSTFVEILFSKYINAHTREEHRATTLSAVSLFIRLPYVVLTLLIGRLADAGLLAEYTLVVGIVSLIVWGLSLILFRHKQLSAA